MSLASKVDGDVPALLCDADSLISSRRTKLTTRLCWAHPEGDYRRGAARAHANGSPSEVAANLVIAGVVGMGASWFATTSRALGAVDFCP